MDFFKICGRLSAALVPLCEGLLRRCGKLASHGLLALLPMTAAAEPPLVQALVSTREIARQAPVRMADLQWRRVHPSQHPRGLISDPAQLDGMSARRRIRAGQVLSPSLLEPSLLIRRGERVLIQASHGQVRASTEGEALSSGGRGAAIEVRNLGSGKRVQAWVVEGGVVSTTTP